MKLNDDQAGAGPAALTPRERDVIAYVAAGKPNKVIAMELGISMRTIETHRARIFHKMGVRNAVELARRVYAPCSLAGDAGGRESRGIRRGRSGARRGPPRRAPRC